MTEYPAHHECPKCGTLCQFQPTPQLSHWGQIRCPQDGHRWISKPAETKKPRRKTNECLKPLLPPEMRSWCWQCLRKEQHLKALRPSLGLQVHHIIEVEDGGLDDPFNLQLLCTECHSETHRRREAFNRYQAGA